MITKLGSSTIMPENLPGHNYGHDLEQAIV